MKVTLLWRIHEAHCLRQTAVWVRPRVNNGFHEDQWLTWKFRGVHDPRRLRDWASQDGAKASVATSITTPVVSTIIMLRKSFRNWIKTTISSRRYT